MSGRCKFDYPIVLGSDQAWRKESAPVHDQADRDRIPYNRRSNGGISTGEFTAAVSNAGGLGLIATVLGHTDNEKALRQLIRTCRSLTDKPFGINIPIIVLDPETINTYIDCCIEEGVKVVETAGQKPKPYAERIKKAGLS